jgi:phage protein D
MARHPRYAPDYRIEVAGKPLPKAVRGAVTSVRFQEGLQESDRVEVALANPDLRWLQEHIKGLGFSPYPTRVKLGPRHGLPLAPAGTFDIDNSLTLAIGYAPDPLQPVFVGDVTGLQVAFPGGGMPTMTLVAHDYLQRLARGRYAQGFGPVPDFIVASILVGIHGLVPVIDPTIVAASSAMAALNYLFNGSGIKQQAESDLEMVKRIAANYDADFWVDGQTFHLARFVREHAPRRTLAYGESLLDFSPQVSTVGQVAGVSVKFALREIPLDFLVTVAWDFAREELAVTVAPGAASRATAKGPVFSIIDRPIKSPADILSSALFVYRKLRNMLNRRLTGSGTAVGDAAIRAGAVIRLEGLGPDFSGDYRVSGATHSIDGGGYRTSFEVRKEILP